MSTLTDYEVAVYQGTDQNANKFQLGAKLQTAQQNITTLQDQVAAIDGVYPTASGYGYIGTRTVAQIDALTPSTGMVVVAGSAGTPSAGTSSLLAIGDVAEYNGTSWIKIVAHSGGFVPNTTVLIVAPVGSTLYSPLTTATDGGKLATFGGSSNTPVLSVPADGVAYAITGTSVNAGKIYQFQTGAGWAVVTSPLSDSNPAALGTVSPGVSVKASRSDHVHPLPAGLPNDTFQAKAVGADRVTNTATETAFATTYTLPANTLAVGSVWEVMTEVYVQGVTGTPSLTIRLGTGGNQWLFLTLASVTADSRYFFRHTYTVGVAGASGWAVIEAFAVSTTSGGTSASKPYSNITAFDTTATQAVNVTAEWDAASASNQVDLRVLSSTYRLKSA